MSSIISVDKNIKQLPLLQENWHVGYTAPRAEKQVALRLQSMGITYYLPLTKQKRHWSDRVKLIELPVFPSYIFIKLTPLDYFAILNLPGMIKYVSFEGKAAIIKEETIFDIKRLISSNFAFEFRDELPKKGDDYIIPSGPLMGLKGKILRLKKDTHFYLEIKELGKYIILPIINLRD